MEIFSKLGIDWRLLIAQLVNFAILLYVLKRFAYAPVMRILDERREKIERGLRDAEAAHKKLSDLEEIEKRIVADARKEAKRIVLSAEQAAQKMSDEIVAHTQEKAHDILEQAKKSIEFEKQKMIQDVRREVGQLVVAATEKVVNVKLDVEKDHEIIKQSLT